MTSEQVSDDHLCEEKFYKKNVGLEIFYFDFYFFGK